MPCIMFEKGIPKQYIKWDFGFLHTAAEDKNTREEVEQCCYCCYCDYGLERDARSLKFAGIYELCSLNVVQEIRQPNSF